MYPYAQYRNALMQMLNDPRCDVRDYVDNIVFRLAEHRAILRLADEQCDYFFGGERKAVFHFSRGTKLAALKRALEESI